MYFVLPIDPTRPNPTLPATVSTAKLEGRGRETGHLPSTGRCSRQVKVGVLEVD
jgi:hypothetical protein